MLPGRKYTPEGIAALAWRQKWLIVVAVSVLTTLAVVASLRLPDQYRSETLILVIPQRVPESYVRSTVTMRIEDRLRSIGQEILSRSRLERIIRDFGLYADQIAARPMEQIVADMRSKIVVDPIRDDAFKVIVTADSPRTAMIVADRLASMFIEENLHDREVQADGTNQFLDSQLVEARRRLVAHEEKLEAYRRQYSGELPTQLQANLQVIQATQSQIQNLTDSINRDRDRRLSLEQALADTTNADGVPDLPATGPIAEPATPESRLLAELEKARTELRELLVRRTPQHPDVIAKSRTIAELETKVRDAAASRGVTVVDPALPAAERIRRTRTGQYQAEIAKLDQQIAAKEADMQNLRQQMSTYQRRVEAVPGHESEMTGLMRDYDTLQKIYTDLLGKKENSQISANLERQQVGEQFRVLDPARLPEKPYSPNRPRIALTAAALGLALAIGLIGLLEYRDMTLRSEDEIVRTLILPVIAAIPMMTATADLRRHRRNMALLAVTVVAAVASMAAALWTFAR